MSEMNPKDLENKASRWAKSQIAAVREGALEQAVEHTTRVGDNDGIAAARALASLKIRIEKYEQFLLAHSAKADTMEPKEWAQRLIDEGISFWGQISAATQWGEHFFCKMVGLSCYMEDDDEQEQSDN